jgi:transglutaminase-like putative cysteine protease
MLGLPARYVSGYLLTQAPESGVSLLGADASHAWVQVWCPGTPGVPEQGPGAAGWTWTPPIAWCPAPGMCAWPSGATLAT